MAIAKAPRPVEPLCPAEFPTRITEALPRGRARSALARDRLAPPLRRRRLFRHRHDADLGADLCQRADFTARPPRQADAAAVMDQPMAQVDPLPARDGLHQISLDLLAARCATSAPAAAPAA